MHHLVSKQPQTIARPADAATHVTLTLPSAGPDLRYRRIPAFLQRRHHHSKEASASHLLNAAPFHHQLRLGSAPDHPPHSLSDIFLPLNQTICHPDPDTMEEERLWKFRKPEWLNSMWARNAGVYGAGALVSSSSCPLFI